jgi:molybdenum cofactor biosynthesis protein B
VSQSEHKARGPATVACFVLTVSDTRTAETDTSGGAIRSLLENAGHEVTGSRIVKDEPAVVRAVVEEQAAAGASVVIITGGTGLTARDGSFEAIDSLLHKRLDGFGELFRMLSYHDIGPAAMLSRATAGTIHHTAVFLLPGSEKAVRLAMEKLILPELGHVVGQVRS